MPSSTAVLHAPAEPTWSARMKPRAAFFGPIVNPFHKLSRRIFWATPFLVSLAFPVAADEAGSTSESDRKQTVIDASRDVVDQQADTASARSLSGAFRTASRRATPSVVTILVYGQAQPGPPNRPRPGGQPSPMPPGMPEGPDSEGESNPSGDENGPGSSDQTGDGNPSAETLTGLGSGVIVTDDGRVITNNHVIAAAKRVVVQLADETLHEATEVRGDAASDVAVLQIDLSDRPNETLAAQLGDSANMEIGDWVLAIGSPFRLEATVSAGIISAKNRRLNRIARSRLFQTDAAINPGNSGGPLIDLDGKVIGINTAIATRNGGYQGVGFAIPIHQARWIANELANHGEVRRAAIGITMAELNRRIANMFNVEPGIGVLAYEIIENSAAERAGIEKLDIITEFAGEKVRQPGALREMIEQLPIGSTQSIAVRRGGDTIELDIVLASIEDPTDVGQPPGELPPTEDSSSDRNDTSEPSDRTSDDTDSDPS